MHGDLGDSWYCCYLAHLLAAYKRRLRGIVEIAPAWMGEEILSASEHIREDRAVLWISKN